MVDPWARACTPEAEEEEGPETAIEITYVDPRDGELCKKDVYCDPQDWQNRFKARLLISADLINLFSEAVEQRQSRFGVLHEKLENARFGYAGDLGRFRKIVQRIFKSLKFQEDATAPGGKRASIDKTSPQKASPQKGQMIAADKEKEKQQEIEPCAVYFYIVDQCMDRWELDIAEKAIKKMRTALLAEIMRLQREVGSMGGGTWKEMMAKMLKKGEDPMDLLVEFTKHYNPGEETDMKIQNALTGGTRDKFDVLWEKMEKLKKQMEEKEERTPELEAEKPIQIARITDLKSQLSDLRGQLKARPVLEKAEYVAKPVVAVKVAKVIDVMPLYLQIVAIWEEKLRLASEDIPRLKKSLAAEKSQLLSPAEWKKIVEDLQTTLKEWTTKTKLLQTRASKLFKTRDKVQAAIEKLQDAVREEKAEVRRLRKSMAGLPDTGPEELAKKMALIALRKQLRQLKVDNKATQKLAKEKEERVESLRYECKKLYKKLGWDWDFSDSEGDEDDDKPYWMRRKMAAGNKGFSCKKFIYAEKDLKKKRKTKAEKQRKMEEEVVTWAQMAARRVAGGGRADDDQEDIAVVHPFHLDKPDGLDASPRSTVASPRDLPRDLPGLPSDVANSSSRDLSFRELTGQRQQNPPQRRHADLRSLPHWAHDPEEMKARCLQMANSHQQRTDLENQLRHSAHCFAETLPPDSIQGGLRQRLNTALLDLHDVPLAPGFWEEEQPGEQLEEVCAVLHGLMHQVVDFGEQVQSIAIAARHAMEFQDLRQRLHEVRASQKPLREELRSVLTATNAALLLNLSPSAIAAACSQSSEEGNRPRGLRSPSPQADLQDASPGSRTMARELVSRDLPMAGSAGPPAEHPGRQTGRPGIQRSGGFDDDHMVGPALRQSQRQLKGSGTPAVDFGFRPDGAGEDSLENWSLFKVSKTSDMTSTQMCSTAAGRSFGFESTSNSVMKGRLSDSKFSKTQSSEGGFGQYMAQLQQSASAPGLKGSDKKKCPSLPQLVNKTASAQTKAMANQWATTMAATTDTAFAARWKEKKSLGSDGFTGYRDVKPRDGKLGALAHMCGP